MIAGSWWVCRPGHVLDQEDPLTWLSDGSSLKALTEKHRSEVKKWIRAVANRLRFVRSRIMATPAHGKLDGILPISLDHLEAPPA